jgi:sulfide:quinone oxidoreductase
MNIEIAITILTPEDAPLAIFGPGVSHAVAELLSEKQIEAVSSAYCEIPSAGRIEAMPGGALLDFDRIVALPELEGPSIPGLPEVQDGFIPVDEHCQVRGVERVYAAGDATDFPVKHGGLASQQADAAAEAIAALAGADVEAQPFDPVIRGMLLTGAKPLYISAHITGGQGPTSEVSWEPLWQPPSKIAARYLSPYLQARAL